MMDGVSDRKQKKKKKKAPKAGFQPTRANPDPPFMNEGAFSVLLNLGALVFLGPA